jgi:hypothetical protein
MGIHLSTKQTQTKTTRWEKQSDTDLHEDEHDTIIKNRL